MINREDERIRKGGRGSSKKQDWDATMSRVIMRHVEIYKFADVERTSGTLWRTP